MRFPHHPRANLRFYSRVVAPRAWLWLKIFTLWALNR